MKLHMVGNTSEIKSLLQNFPANEELHISVETNGHRLIPIGETIADVVQVTEKPVSAQKAYWSRMSPVERSKEMKRRLKLGRRSK
jgi:hypothetical protein